MLASQGALPCPDGTSYKERFLANGRVALGEPVLNDGVLEVLPRHLPLRDAEKLCCLGGDVLSRGEVPCAGLFFWSELPRGVR